MVDLRKIFISIWEQLFELKGAHVKLNSNTFVNFTTSIYFQQVGHWIFDVLLYDEITENESS
jgi:hypothetical protein